MPEIPESMSYFSRNIFKTTHLL